ncbi:MAG: hypothetical protein F6J86_20920 [Symploca sp. SIO1B1]|nr:hypothetical protein [Symploca sp. SIO2D2]NER96273.1 hypothetical protein [Symploca sp. SIO1B1]
MPQTVLTKPGSETATALIDNEPYYPQCYLYQPTEVELERNLSRLDILLFSAGVSLESAHQAAKVITSIKPGFIISRAEYQAIYQALKEMK